MPDRSQPRSGLRCALAAATAIALLATLLCPAVGSGNEPGSGTGGRLSPPASRLNRAPSEAPVICGILGFGGAFEHDQGRPVVGGAVVFRPSAAAGFLDFLYDWNTGLVLQAERLALGSGGRSVSADLILRRYSRTGDAGGGGGHGRQRVPFWGAGLGASSASVGADGDMPALKYWSVVAEGGQEWRFANGRLLMVKGQLRYFHKGGSDYSAWTVSAGAGLPFPF